MGDCWELAAICVSWEREFSDRFGEDSGKSTALSSANSGDIFSALPLSVCLLKASKYLLVSISSLATDKTASVICLKKKKS